MIYIIAAALILLSLHPMSYAKYNWAKKQYFQAAGMVFVVMVMVSLSVFVLLTR